KRDAAGHSTPRQRIDMLLDPGSFIEIGALVKMAGEGNPYSDGVMTGHGTVDGRPVAVFAHDQTVFGGAAGEMFGRKVAAVND
ncbi:carboxyl transferase domain-containing protein, partial [Staphylococcus aureus]